MKLFARSAFLAFLSSAAFAASVPLPSEIAVKLKMDQNVFVFGERIRAVVSVDNTSLDSVDVGSRGSEDSFMLELYRASEHQSFPRVSSHPFVAPFTVHSSEGQRLEAVFSDHFAFSVATRYLARAVLIHKGVRYESAFKSFDVVPGMRAGGAMQMFANQNGLRREFELAHWGRDRMEHLFLKARDKKGEVDARRWNTVDLGPYMSVTAPKISIADSGEVTVLHRSSQDHFTRSVFWSLPEAFEFQTHSVMADPDVAGAERVKNVYREAGAATKGEGDEKKSWWKLW